MEIDKYDLSPFGALPSVTLALQSRAGLVQPNQVPLGPVVLLPPYHSANVSAQQHIFTPTRQHSSTQVFPRDPRPPGAANAWPWPNANVDLTPSAQMQAKAGEVRIMPRPLVTVPGPVTPQASSSAGPTEVDSTDIHTSLPITTGTPMSPQVSMPQAPPSSPAPVTHSASQASPTGMQVVTWPVADFFQKTGVPGIAGVGALGLWLGYKAYSGTEHRGAYGLAALAALGAAGIGLAGGLGVSK